MRDNADLKSRPLALVAALLLTAACLVLPFAADAAPDDPDLVSHADYPHGTLELSAGQIGLADSLSDPLVLGVEYVLPPMGRWGLRPSAGYTWSDNDAHYGYVAVRRDFNPAGRWLLTPSFGAGLFTDSDQLRLGHELEFRTSLAIAYRFDNRYRLGAAVFHLSNGGISEINPGTESAVLFFSRSL